MPPLLKTLLFRAATTVVRWPHQARVVDLPVGSAKWREGGLAVWREGRAAAFGSALPVGKACARWREGGLAV